LSTVEYYDRLYRIEDSRINKEGTFAEVLLSLAFILATTSRRNSKLFHQVFYQ